MEPVAWWIAELQALLCAGNNSVITLDMKRAANIALKVARGARWDDASQQWIDSPHAWDVLYATPQQPAPVSQYDELIDATPENQRETMLYDALKERDNLRAEMMAHQAAAPEIDRLRAINEELVNALDTAKNGLLWYEDTYPCSVNACDDEAMAQIDAAIAKAKS